MRKLLFWVSVLCFLVIIGASTIVSVAAEVAVGKSAVETPMQATRGLSNDDRGSASNPLAMKVDEWPEHFVEVFVSVLMLLIAIVQAILFYWQLRFMAVANKAAVTSLDASNPPQIRISNPQIWCGNGEPFERETDVVKLEQVGRFSARVYVINEGGGAAHVDTDVGVDGNVCVAWFSDLNDGQLPMFRPYKEESRVKTDKFRLKKNIKATARPELQDWVERNPNGADYLTLQPGEIARWDLGFSVEEPFGGDLKKALYLMGIVVYWCLSGDQRTRRRAIGFAYKFDQERQVFKRLSSEDYPDYVFDE
jgi:hypothetical protein